jgi:hypothetical protein
MLLVGATGFEPATTCTPTTNPGGAADVTGRTDSQGLENTEALEGRDGAPDALGAPGLTGNGAHMGRGNLPESEIQATTLEELGRQVAEAIARGEFDRARELTEEGIRQRTSNGS